MENKYITPTKENPVFNILNTYEGYIVNDYLTFKNWEIKKGESWFVGETSALSLPDAMQALFEHIKNNPTKENGNYVINMIDGTINKFGEVHYIKAFEFSNKQAKKFKII